MNLFKTLNSEDKSALLLALDNILANKWESAHEIAQSKEGNPAYDRVHALLHRIEGDQFNAKYWYNRTGVNMPKCSFEQETKELISELKK